MNLFKRLIAFFYGKSRQFYYERRYNVYREKYSIDSSFGFNGTDIRIYGEGILRIDKNSYIGSMATIQIHKNAKVEIGYNCQISHNVRIYTSSADPNQDFTKKKIKNDIVGDVIIGNGVWIGANVFINPGIIIGNNSVIGANSVVTKNVEPNCIFGGVPAKLIKRKDFLYKQC